MSKMVNRKLVIAGAFGGVNVGDEIILEADLDIIRGNMYAPEIHIAGTIRKDCLDILTRDHYRELNVNYISLRDLFVVVRKAWGADVVVGGGQVIDGTAGPKLALAQLVMALAARLSGGRVSVGGAGAFRLDHWTTRRAYSLLFALCEEIIMRDAHSLALLTFSDAARRKGRVGADVVFALRDALRLPERTVKSRGPIVFTVHHAPHVEFLQLDSAVKLARRLLDAKPPGTRLQLAAHDKRVSFDLGFAYEVAKRLGSDEVDIVVFDSTAQCIKLYRSASVIVSARMHPIIIGACADCACVPLRGSEKVARVAERLAIPLWDPEKLVALDGPALQSALAARPAATRLAELASEARGAFNGVIGARRH